MIDKIRLDGHLSNGEMELVMCAANYYDDGIDYNFKPFNIDKGFVVCGWRHPNCGEVYLAMNTDKDFWGNCVQGFLTTKNRFLNREESLKLVQSTGQLKRKLLGSELTSEDLWSIIIKKTKMKNWISKNFESKNRFYLYLLSKIGMILMIIFMFTACCNDCNAQDVTYDKFQPWVTDLEDLLTPEQEKELNNLIAEYEAKTTCEIAILTTSDYEGFGDISEYAITLGEKWGVGKEGIDNGLMIVISKVNDENFVATGYGLEGYLTDAYTKRMQDSIFGSKGNRPLFYDGKYYEGLTLFVQSCIDKIGDEYSSDENMTKKGEDYVYVAWEWFVAIPWYWKVIVGGLYVLLWIVSPGTAWYLTIMLLTLGRGGSSMGGGKFGGGGSRS